MVDLDTRWSQLELDNTLAFHVVLASYSSLPEESVLIFDEVNINIGNGYDATSGISLCHLVEKDCTIFTLICNFIQKKLAFST